MPTAITQSGATRPFRHLIPSDNRSPSIHPCGSLKHNASTLKQSCPRFANVDNGFFAYAQLHPRVTNVHVLFDAHGYRQPHAIRQWLKRWLSESLNTSFPCPASGWWAEAGSTKPVAEASYLNNVTHYIERQRTTRP